MLHAVFHLAKVQVAARKVLLGELVLREAAVFPAALVGVAEMVDEFAEPMPLALFVDHALVDGAVRALANAAFLELRQSDV